MSLQRMHRNKIGNRRAIGVRRFVTDEQRDVIRGWRRKREAGPRRGYIVPLGNGMAMAGYVLRDEKRAEERRIVRIKRRG